jgi:hypothetical protein
MLHKILKHLRIEVSEKATTIGRLHVSDVEL